MKRQSAHFVVVAALLLAAHAAASGATPDFSGTWERYPDPYGPDLFAEDPPPPAGGPKLKEPYASQYRKFNQRKADGLKKGKPLADPASQCLPEGMPTIMAASRAAEEAMVPPVQAAKRTPGTNTAT